MIKTLLSPLLLSFVCLFTGLGLTSRRWKKLTKIQRCSLLLLGFGTMMLFVFSLPFVSSNIASYLENDYLSYNRSAIEQLDVIVVLAGGLKRGHGTAEDELTGLTYSRTVAGIRAFKSTNAQFIVMSVGTVDSKYTRMVDIMRSLSLVMWVPIDILIVYPLSLNTF